MPLPYWLYLGAGNELMRALCVARGNPAPEVFNVDLIPNHRRFWFEDTIQTFWAGTTPTEHPEYGDLYYELCHILVHLLSEKARSLGDFLRCAARHDAGQSAARVCLKTDLGDLAGTFLGPGHWTPDPLAIAECWERARRIGAGDSPE